MVLEGGYGPSHGLAISNIFDALLGRHYERDTELARPSTHYLVEKLKKVQL